MGTERDKQTVAVSTDSNQPDSGPWRTIGRADDNNIRAEHDTVSRHHARLRAGDGGFWIEDCGSSGGTCVDGRQLQPGVPELFPWGTAVQFGAFRACVGRDAQGSPALVELNSLPASERRVIVLGSERGDRNKLQSTRAVVDFLVWSMIPLGALAGRALKNIFGRPESAIKPVLLNRDVAVASFQFPQGDPTAAQAFALHPLDPQRYLPVESFHRLLFEEKRQEFLTLLACLGATETRIRHVEVDAVAKGGSVGVAPVPENDVAVKGSRGQSAGREAWSLERLEPRRPFGVPDGLKWFHHTPEWQGLARRRLEHGLLHASARLEYVDSFGIDASLKAALSGLGVALGASFRDFKSELWEYEVTFLPL